MSEITPEDKSSSREILPTYYVTHPDGSFSLAGPQPTAEQVASQIQPPAFLFAQCDYKHVGEPCQDPHCYLADAHARLHSATPDMLAALQAVLDFIEGKPDAIEPFGLVRDAVALALGGPHG